MADQNTEDVQVEEGTEGSASPDIYKMNLQVNITNSGPCKRHVQVVIPRQDIDHYYELALGDLSGSASVPGFRPGHAPKKLLEKRFRKELAGQLKQKILLESLEQLAEQHKLDPINEPDLNVDAIEIPEEGDFQYEFEVEVRPEFDLPDYKGLKIERPVEKVSDADVDAYLERFLSQYGELTEKEGAAEPGDYITADVHFYHGEKEIHDIEDLTVCLRPVLQFQDAQLDGFDEFMKGVTPGEEKETSLQISQESEFLEMRGESVTAKFRVSKVSVLTMPQLDKEFLERLDMESEEELRTEIRAILERQATYRQRQAVRGSVLEKITEAANWDLPEKLVMRQVENALRREVLEMSQAGFTTKEIQARENELRQKAVSTTRQALKEHFVLDKIANGENIQVTPEDMEVEIGMMALQRGESPRRVRSRLVKSGMIENLEAQIRERKAVDFILSQAEFVDKEVPGEKQESRIEAVRGSVCGLPSVSGAGSLEEESEESEE